MTIKADHQCSRSVTQAEAGRARGYTMPVPYGWYAVLDAAELPLGGVQTIRRFGKDWVLFRDETGRAAMVEPFCPHLGAHLGHGGKVRDGLLHCPFHGWGFDHEGYCRSIPYARTMPPQLKRAPALDALPVTEANRMIWAWYHPHRHDPMWDVEVIDEAGNPSWVARPGYTFEIHSIPQEIGENSVDIPHLRFVHGQEGTFDGVSRYDGHVRTTAISGPIMLDGPDGAAFECPYSLDFSQMGPGVQIVRMDRHIQLIMQITITPVEAALLVFRMRFFHPDYADNQFLKSMVDDLIAEQADKRGNYEGITADIPIWDNKIYRDRPLLCDGDGRIIEYRKWFSQFYEF